MYVYSGTILRYLESYFPFIANIVHFSFYQSHSFLTFGYFFFFYVAASALRKLCPFEPTIIRTGNSCSPFRRGQKGGTQKKNEWMKAEKEKRKTKSQLGVGGVVTSPVAVPRNATACPFSTATATAVMWPLQMSGCWAVKAYSALLARGEGRNSAPHLYLRAMLFWRKQIQIIHINADLLTRLSMFVALVSVPLYLRHTGKISLTWLLLLHSSSALDEYGE